MKRVIKGIGHPLAVFLAMLLLSLTVLFGLAQTDVGKKATAKMLTAILCMESKGCVEVEGLTGLIPLDFRVDRITFRDPAGQWLVLEDISFSWSPLSLVRGIFHVEKLDVKLARLSRFAQGREKFESESNALLSRSLYFQRLRMDRFAVERISMGDAILGKQADFRAWGRIMSAGSDGVRSSFLQFVRIDEGGGKILFEAALRGEEPMLTIGFHVEEDAEGLMPALLKFHHPISLSLNGEGPVQAFNGTLRADIGGVGSLGADIGLTIRDTPTMTLKGVLRPEPGLMPAQMSSMLGGEGRFGLAVRLLKPNVLSVDLLTLDAGPADLQVSGRMDIDKETVDGQFTFGCRALGFMDARTNLSFAGDLAVDGHFSGPLFQPKTAFHIKTLGLEVGSVGVSKLGGDFTLRFLGKPDVPFPGIHVSGIGHMEGVSFRDARNVGRTFPEPRLKWRLDADVPLKQTIHIRQLELKGEKLALGLLGRMNTAGPGGTFDVLLDVMDTQGLSDFFGFELPGPARLNAKVQGDQYDLSLTAHVQGKIDLLARKYRPFASIFGEEIDFTGDLTLTEAKGLKASELRLETRTGTLIADASLDLSQGGLDGSWRFSVPELSVFSTAIKQNVGGLLHAEGKLKGIPGKMTLNSKAFIQDLQFQGVGFDHATATVHIRETTSGGAGDISVELRQAGRKARATADFTLNGHRLNLYPISMDAAGGRIYGNMTFFLDRDLAEGVLQAECEDISDPAALFGKELKGGVHTETQFKIVGTEQQVLFTMWGKDLASKTAQVNNLKMSGRLTKLTQAPQGNVALDIEGLSFNELSVTSLTLGADQNIHKMTFSGKIEGKYKSDFEIATAGNVVSSQEGLTLNLERLNGQFAGSALALIRTTQIKRTARGWKFEPFALELDEGRIRGSGSCTDGMVDVNIQFEDLPFEALQFAGHPGLRGSGAGSIDFSGPISHPEGGIILRPAKLRFRNGQHHELPPFVLQAKAALKNNYVHADLTLEDPADRPLELSIEIPVRFSLSPFVWDVPAQGKIRGRLAGGLDLAHALLFVDLPDQNLGGQMEISLSLDGTAGDPRIMGYVRIRDGVYENVRSGTFLKDAEMEIAADSSRLIVERGLMRDGEGGTISLQGRVDLVRRRDFPFNFALVFEKVALVRQDYANAIAGGKLTFSGSLAETMLAGGLEIVSADFQIPKRLPPDVTELEVIEINRVGEDPGNPQTSIQSKKHVIKLNASVLSPGHMFIRGRGLESEWKGTLSLTGTADEPVITGKLSVVRGFFNFLGKGFNLKEGQINFYGAFPPSPSLEVLAEFSTRDMLARLRLSGPITEPLLELSSEPWLPKDEILSHILFGRNRADISPVQAIQLAQAVDLLAGGDLDFLGRVRRFLGVDQLEVKETENDIPESDVSQTGIESSAISVGKYVHEKVYVTTERGMQDESGKVIVEVEVTPNITVETEVKENAEGGMGVKWKWNY